jgi:hypothetical protein
MIIGFENYFLFFLNKSFHFRLILSFINQDANIFAESTFALFFINVFEIMSLYQKISKY